MNVFVTTWDEKIEGLGLDGGGVRIWDVLLRDAVDSAVKEAGFRRVEAPIVGESTLVVPGGTAVLSKGLSLLAQVGRDSGSDVRFHLGGRLGELLDELPGDRPAFGWLAPGGQGTVEDRLRSAPVVEVSPVERRIPVPVAGRVLDLVLSDHLVLPVRHWSHLLWGALLGIGPTVWKRAILDHPLRGGARLAWSALCSWSLDPLRLAPALNDFSRKLVHVHPSAVVEGCVLSDGVRIGAGAVVRGSILGPGARVEEQALCEGSVLSDGAVVQRQAMLRFSVLGPDAMHGGVTQLSVLGSSSELKRGAYGMDQSFTGEVRVQAGSEIVGVPLSMIGICLGPRARVGSGVWIAPGRAVPAESVLISDRVVTRPDREQQ
ncbi:MAG: hypothetical protein VX519_04025 [Myxococcota bacterium]|nr:hypothetical protein [Myxococcota bacterium]